MASKVPRDADLTPEMRRFLDDQARGSDSIDERVTAIEDELVFASQVEAETGTDIVKYMNPLRTAQAIAALAQASVFTESFTSSAQTVSAAGGLTLAHGLSGVPTLVQCRLKCTSTDAGYAVDDEVVITTQAGDNTNTGLAVWPDATNVNVRFGSAATTSLQYLNKTTGALTALTDTKWQLIVRAWR